MNIQVLKGLLAVSVFGLAMQAGAYEVTIYDGDGYTRSGAAGEDQETEPGMVNSQVWDMEGFFLDNQSLTMVGGFNYVKGEGGYSAGDIFLAVGVTPSYGAVADRSGNANAVVDNTYGYNYVLDMDYINLTYNLLEINATTQVSTGYYKQNEGSSPFQYVSGAVADESGKDKSVASGDFTIEVVTEYNGFAGEKHYVLAGLDLSVLMAEATSGTTFYSHFTMGCGNDNLMGSWEVPEPASIALLSMGLFGLWFARRKQRSAATFSA